MEKGKGLSASSPIGERNSQWEPEILIIPLRPSLETPASTAQVEAQSPPKQAQSPSKTDLFQEPMSPQSPRSPTSPANGQSSSSIKHLQSLFERENLPQTVPVTPGKRSSLSSPNEQHTNSLRQLQLLFEKEPITKSTLITPNSNATTSPVNEEKANCVKDEGKNVPPQLVPVPLSGKTATSPVNGSDNSFLMDKREHITQQVSITSKEPNPKSPLNGEPAISIKQLQSLFNREQVHPPEIISSSNKASTSLVDREKACLPRDERQHVPKVIFVTSSNQTTPCMNGEDTGSLEHDGKHVPYLVPVTLSDTTSKPPMNGDTDYLKEIQSLNKRQVTLPTPLSLSDTSPTSALSVEQVRSSKEIHLPHEGRLSLELPRPPLAKTELIEELRKGKVLRPTHQTQGLTTVFSGSSKYNCRVSMERADSTVSSPESDGPLPLSPLQNVPYGHTPPVFPRSSST